MTMYSKDNLNIDKNSKELRERMIISTPKFYSISDSVLNFDRNRKILIEWGNILKNEFSIPNYLKSYFSKGLSENYSYEKLLKDSKGIYWDFYNYKKKTYILQNDKMFTEEENINVFCIIQNSSRRLFAITENDDFLVEEKVSNFLDKPIDNFWSQWDEKTKLSYKIGLIENDVLIFTDLQQPEYYSRELLFYKEKFDLLISKLKFIQTINSRLDGNYKDSENKERNFLKETIEKTEDFQLIWDNKNIFESYAEKYSKFKQTEYSILNNLLYIQNKMLNQGFYFHFGQDEDNKQILGASGNVKHGKVYTFLKETKEIKGKPIKKAPKPNYGDDFTGWTPKQKEKGWTPYKLPEEIIGYEPSIIETTTKLTEFNNFEDQINNKIINLKSKNTVHVIENIKGEFISDSGETLKEIVDYCELSDKVRLSTVVVIKNYDFIDTDKKSVIGATFFFNPLPEIIPSRLPTLNFLETLDYRMSWDGLELGKLLNSINLAPGETKTIQFSSKFSQSNSFSNSSRSFSEINTASTTETTTEFEKEATKELNKTNESNSSVSAGGSYGGFNASGSVSNRSTDSLKTFTRDMSKIANKVTNSLNRKASLEVNISSATSTQKNYDSSNISSISNINQGSTLNLYYYQVNNRFKSRLYIENLRIQITNSLEILEGSGIYESKIIKLGDIEQIIKLTRAATPKTYFNLNDLELEDIIIKSIISTFNEYTNLPLLYKSEIEKQVISANSTKAIKISKSLVESFNDNSLSGEALLSKYQLLMSSIDFENYFVSEDNLILDAGSYYLDSLVGVNPATEAYSEKMRNLESLKVSSDIRNKELTNDSIKAKNALINNGMPYIVSKNTYLKNIDGVDTNLTIVEISKEVEKNSNFLVFLNNREMTNVKLEVLESKKTILVNWNENLFESIESITLISVDYNLIIS